MIRLIIFCCLMLFIMQSTQAQEPDKIYMPGIKSVKFFIRGNQNSYPIIDLGTSEALELHFDELGDDIKDYYYTFQLCDADWTPNDLNPLDYMKGFTRNRISQYRVSSIAVTHYTHYAALLPEKSCIPTLSGNYLLKVFLDGDTSKLAFTARMLVVDNKAEIAAQILQPLSSEYFLTSQRLQFSVDKSKFNILNPAEQLKVTVLQNYRWNNAISGKQPVFMRGNIYEYNGERDFIFPAGKEYRWADLRSFRFLSDRMADANLNKRPFEVTLQKDPERVRVRYLFYQDWNGFYSIGSTDNNVDQWTQGDYAKVLFTFVPENRQPFAGKNVYVIGQMTNYELNDSTEMQFNSELGVYEKTLFLKQGYYSYTYATANKDSRVAAQTQFTDGNFWETENSYVILVYYKSLSGRSDELVGIRILNSKIR